MMIFLSSVGWAGVFLPAHQSCQIPRGQTIEPFAHPTRSKKNRPRGYRPLEPHFFKRKKSKSDKDAKVKRAKNKGN
jgi:hypothetical protein